MKAILFDVDGVLLDHEDCDKHNWLDNIENDFNISRNIIELLHKNSEQWKLLSLGRSDLEEYLKKFLDENNITRITPLQLLNYFIKNDTCTRLYMLNEVKKLSANKNYKLYIATHQIPSKADRLWYIEKYKDYFDKIYTSYDVGHLKTETAFFDVISKDIGIKNSDMILIDDKQKNIDTAIKAGCEGFLYTTFEDFKENFFKKNIIDFEEVI